MALWIIWLIAGAALLVIELLSGIVATLCVAVGCIVAAVAALIGCGIELQLAALAAGVILAFIFIAPMVNRLRQHHRSHREEYNSNMNALIGREAIMTHPCEGDAEPGRARIDGDNWQVRSADGSPISRGETVTVTGYDSIILIVKRDN